MNTAVDLGAQANLSRSSLCNSPANLKGIGLHGYGFIVSVLMEKSQLSGSGRVIGD